MGVYIPKLMDMPEHCYECLLRQGNCCLLLHEAIPPTVPLTRLDDCPLIEIDLVRCGECKWYEPRHIKENGIECAGQCIWHIGLKTYCDAHDRENPEDRPRMIIFREPTDFCSYGERRADE